MKVVTRRSMLWITAPLVLVACSSSTDAVPPSTASTSASSTPSSTPYVTTCGSASIQALIRPTGDSQSLASCSGSVLAEPPVLRISTGQTVAISVGPEKVAYTLYSSAGQHVTVSGHVLVGQSGGLAVITVKGLNCPMTSAEQSAPALCPLLTIRVS